jgi:leucyl-tRNA synthetase
MDAIKDVKPFDGNPDSLDSELREVYRKTHQSIHKVTKDIEDRFHFNTAISAIMELFNTMSGVDLQKDHSEKLPVLRFAVESMTLLLAPIVPHFAEELWQSLGNRSSVFLTAWPQHREAALENDELQIVVQVNGKLRSRFQIAAGTPDDTIKELALKDKRTLKFLGDKEIKKVIVVKNKLVNIVI